MFELIQIFGLFGTLGLIGFFLVCLYVIVVLFIGGIQAKLGVEILEKDENGKIQF